MRVLALGLLTLALAGCCGGPEYALLAFDTRLELEQRERFALIATVSSDTRAWAYGTPEGALLPLVQDYRPGDAGSDRLLPVSEAPEQVAAALAALRRGAEQLGYRLAIGDEAPEFVLSVALSWYDDGALARVAMHVGALLDGVFEPHRVAIAATLPEDEPCQVSADELAESLVTLLPPYDPRGGEEE